MISLNSAKGSGFQYARGAARAAHPREETKPVPASSRPAARSQPCALIETSEPGTPATPRLACRYCVYSIMRAENRYTRSSACAAPKEKTTFRSRKTIIEKLSVSCHMQVLMSLGKKTTKCYSAVSTFPNVAPVLLTLETRSRHWRSCHILQRALTAEKAG